MHFTNSIAAAILAYTASVSAINVIGIKDRHFYDTKTNEPFFVKGVDYQPGGPSKFKSGADPLSDANACARDIYLFQQLGINTVRVYSVDPLVNHDECMTMMAAAGIYLVLDLNSPLYGQHLHATEPWTTYTPAYLQHIFTVLEVFSGYDNLLSVLAGNEVVFESGSSVHAPRYVKAVVRDVKDYMDKHIKRKIPVGYANADKMEYRISMAKYLECGKDNEAVDFFGVNSYQWCGASTTYETSGYNTLVESYQDYSLPLFFTEYGCNNPGPRVFNEVKALYSEKMTGVFSGGLVYEMTETGNGFGLLNITDNKDARWGVEFDNLKSKFSSASNKPTIPKDVTTPTRPTTCEKSYDNLNGTLTLPDTLGADLIKNGVSADKWKRGAFMSTEKLNMKTSYKISDAAGKAVSSPEVKIVQSVTPGSSTSEEGKNGKGDKKSAAPSLTGSISHSTIWTLSIMGAIFAMFL